MIDAQTEARAIVAPLDEIPVGKHGACSWGDVATASSEVERRIAAALAAKDAELAELKHKLARSIAREALAALSTPVDGVRVKPSYQRIIEIVQGCVQRMQKAGESHRMLARWISTEIDAELSALTTSETEARLRERVAEALELAAANVDAAWRAKSGINCSEVCAIIRAAGLESGSPYRAESRLAQSNPAPAAGGQQEAVAWEYFSDPGYFDLWAVRPVGTSDFNATFHVHSKAEAEALVKALSRPAEQAVTEVRPLDEWHEDYGDAVWWTWQDGQWLGEPSYIGGPNDSDWPGYHTHWSPHPAFPAALQPQPVKGEDEE